MNSYNLGTLNYTENLFSINYVELNFPQKSTKNTIFTLKYFWVKIQAKTLWFEAMKKSIKFFCRSQKRQGRRDKVENFHISFHFSDFFLQTVELDLCIRKKLKSFRGFFGKLCTVYKKGKKNVVSHTYLHSQSAKGTVFEKSSKFFFL